MTWVHERIFAAGGAHIPATWESFRAQTGIEAVLNVNPGNPSHFVGDPPTRFLWIDVGQESEADMEARLLAGRFLKQAIESGDRVLLHSGQGRHRTRWAYVAFLLCHGKTVATALRQAAETPWLAPYDTDREQWRALARYLKASSIGPAA